MATHQNDHDIPIAVVGMGCRFPGGSTSPEKFWDLLSKGRSAWSKVPAKRFNQEAFYHPATETPGAFNSKGGHFLKEDIAAFDAPFFNISPLEAKAMDPQQRLQLETAYEALENAGLPMDTVIGSNTAVYVGIFNGDYERILHRDPERMPFYQATGTGAAVLSNRISYFFDLKGPSMTIDTGCSGSMVALHLACQSLRTGESRQAIVGGSNLILDPSQMIPMSYLKFFSDEGRCYTYDKRGAGYGRGEGAAAVILKRLDDALRDGDPIRAVIRNTAVNQDGKTPGLTMPGRAAQESMIRSAYENAHLNMKDTGYFEAHGTGTPAGDPIEAGAIAATLGRARPPGNPIIVGSVKTNIGHLESSSGIASLIKTILILEKGMIPPNFNFQEPNDKIPLEEWRIRVPQRLEQWPTTGLRRASVNSFGYGGTNAHVILDDAYHYLSSRGLDGLNSTTVLDHPNGRCPVNGSRGLNGFHGTNGHGTISGLPVNSTTTGRKRVFVLSTRHSKSTRTLAYNLKTYVSQNTSIEQEQFLDDMAHTLFARRSTLEWRSSITADSSSTLISALDDDGLEPRMALRNPKLGFVFTGQGAQWYGMGRELIQAYPVFANSLANAEKYFTSFGAPWLLLNELLLSEQSSRVSKASIGQPLCTAIQLALVDLLASWNIKPSAVTGHSSGEIAAAYASGALDFKDALKVSFYRGQLANTIPEKASHLKGAMLAVGLSEEKARRIINQLEGKGGKMVVACVNSPSSVTVSGDETAIIELQDILEARMIFNRRLVVDTAYHSHHMEVIAREYLASLSDIQPQKTSEFVRFVSSVTGRQMAGNELDAAYWVRNMVSQVRFSMALECMCIRPAEKQLGQSWSKYAVDSIVEIGPHSALAGPIKQTLKSDKLQDARIRYLSALVRGKDACTTALDVAGTLFTEGFSVDLTSVNFPHGRGKRNVLVDLPSYPWNHGTKYWDESRLSSEYRLRKHPRHPLLGVPAPDYNPLEPRWRNVIRLSEFPWLRGHVVQSSIVYPAAGYVAMVIEAAKQRHVGSGRKDHILKYGFRDVNVGKALVIPDTPEGVELMLSIRPYARTARDSSDTWDEFRIFSFAEKEGWSEHCRGLISLQFKAGSADFEGDRETHFAAMKHADKFSKAEAHCKAVLEPKELYEGLANLGLEYSGVFTGVVSIRAQPNESLVVVQIPDTKSMLPGNFEQPHVLHPATLDACFQTIFCAMMKGVGITDTLVPTFIEELSVSGNIISKPGHEFKVLSSTTASGLRGLKADLVVANVCSTGLPLISIQGLKCTALLGGGPNETLPTSQEKRMCHKLKWLPDLEFLEATQIKELCKKNLSDESHADMLWVLNAVTDLAIRDTLKSLEGWDKTLLSLHHKHMYEWMTKYANESPAHPGSKACDLRRRAETFGSHGEMTLRIGDNLTAILKGEIDPLSVMMEKNLLYQVYADESSRRCHVQMIEYVDMLAHKHPDMKVLEIGAGTGGTTLPILKAFGGGSPGSGPARLGHFDFTDISSGFFEKAEELLKPWEGLVSFKKLDIEKDTKAQGFEDASYDLIVASNVLHATAVMDVTMSNVRRLLKPGGKLMLSEITRPTPYIGLVFGTLPGWWLGAPDGRVDSPLMNEETWEATLLRNGLTGLDLCLQDYPAENCKYAVTSVIVSSAKPVTPQPAFSPVELIYGQRSASISIPLAKLLNANLTTLEETSATGKVCVVLPEMHEHILSSGSPSQFGAIKNMLSTAKGVLWVTQGAAMDCTAPDNSLITGLARTVRNDNEALRLVTLDLDPDSGRSDAETAEIIYNIYKSAFNDATQCESQDSEFAERGGKVFIPRLVEDSELNTYLKASTTVRDPEVQPFFQEGRALHLEVGQPGLLDSLRWVDDETVLLPLAPDEIRLELRAAGINFRDIMISLGQLEGTSRMGGECAGVVTDVGSNMTKKFKVGDRVCSWGAGAYASSARVHGPSAQHIPDDMSFETAASLPIVYTTVYYSLVYLARLQKGETILIHSAAGGVGQAAIMLSQHIGAKAFVTVGSEEKKRFLMDNYHVPEERIFSSRQTTFGEGIKRLTGGKGVDVVLNSLTGEGFRETCNCVAYFGRFIEIGKRDVLMNARMDMALFDKNVTFSSVDLTKVCDHDVNLAGRLFKEVFDLIRQGSVGAVKPVTILPLSEIETAFRQIQAGKHMGKIVLQAQPDVQVKVIPRSPASVKFDDNASYLIVGGLGGLGRVICKWMASLGAKNIIILSRSGVKGSASVTVAKELKEAGVNLAVHACDIGDYAQVKAALDICAKNMPPIRGVIQAAMVLKDSTLENMTYEDLHTALRPKVQGTLNIHNLVPQKLDFFITLSSGAGIVGNHGQGNYAAGSTFQDAFARQQAGKGLPVRSIDLGMVEGAGYVSENLTSMTFLQNQGFVPVALSELLATLNYAITSPPSDIDSSQLIVGLQRPDAATADSTSLFSRDLKFSQFVTLASSGPSSPSNTSSQTFDVQKALKEACSQQSAGDIIANAILAKLSKVLAVPLQDLSAAQSIAHYGADSLVAVELRNWFARTLEVNIRILDLLSATPINELAANMATQSKLVDPALFVKAAC